MTHTQAIPFNHHALHNHVHGTILDILNEKDMMSFEQVIEELASMLPILHIAANSQA